MHSYFLNNQKMFKKFLLLTHLKNIKTLHILSLMDINQNYLEIYN